MRFFSKLLKPKNAIAVAVKVAKLVEILKDELKDYDFNKHKTEPSLIEYIGRLIESEFQKKKIIDKKVNKKEILIEILERLVGTQLSQQDKDLIQPIIEHLHSTGRFKLVSNKRVLKHSFFSFLVGSQREK